MEIEFIDSANGVVLCIDGQVIGLVRRMPYLDLPAYELGRTFVEHAAYGDGGVVFDMPVEGYLEGGVKLLFGRSFDGGDFDILCLKHLLLA